MRSYHIIHTTLKKSKAYGKRKENKNDDTLGSDNNLLYYVFDCRWRATMDDFFCLFVLFVFSIVVKSVKSVSVYIFSFSFLYAITNFKLEF